MVDKEKSLAYRFPELAKEWHPVKNGLLKASDVTSFTTKKVWWLCEKGHEWTATVANRSKGQGCSVCAGKKVLKGYNDLESQNPILAKEWHPTKNGDLLPSHVTTGSGKRVWWKCQKGHEWLAYINNRNKGSGCPTCADEKPSIRRKKVLCVETGEVFESVKIAAEKKNISHNVVSACCNGRQKTAGGYHWEFMD